MRTISLRVEDATIEILETKAKEDDITISEYLRKQIFPLVEGTKPLSLEQSLAKLERSVFLLHVCVKPLRELLFGLEKLETELIVKQEMAHQNAPLAEKQPEFEKPPIEEEKKPDEQSQDQPQTATGPT